MTIQNIPDSIKKEISLILNKELNTAKNNIEKLEICYEQVDKILSIIKDCFPCKPGCCFCCKSDVLITQFEAIYISKKTGINLKNKKFSLSNHSDCPFLKENICSIYKYRPFICRTYHIATDPKHCTENQETRNYQYGTELGNYGNPIFKSIGDWIIRVNNKMNYCRKDIRDFFL